MSEEFDAIISPEETKIVDEVASKLGEHFDTVQIFVSKREGGDSGTGSYLRGVGNWFARYGQVREWLIREDERTRIAIREDTAGGSDEKD